MYLFKAQTLAHASEFSRFFLWRHPHAIGDNAVRLALDGGIDVIEHGYGTAYETRDFRSSVARFCNESGPLDLIRRD